MSYNFPTYRNDTALGRPLIVWHVRLGTGLNKRSFPRTKHDLLAHRIIGIIRNVICSIGQGIGYIING